MEVPSTDIGDENGFEVLRARLQAEYEGNVVRLGLDAPRIDELEHLINQIKKHIDDAEAYARNFYFSHGRIIADGLIAKAKELGMPDDELTELVRSRLDWEVPSSPTVHDIRDTLFVAAPGDETPLLNPAQVIEETMNGLNHRIAEHLGIEE